MPLYDEYGQPVPDDEIANYIQQNQQQTQQTPNWRRDLESRAQTAQEKATEAEQRAQAAERKLAFVEAGVDLKHPMAPYFIEGYKGDVTAEAIQAKAAELGLAAQAPQQQPPQNPAQQAQADAFRQMQQATDGHVAPAERDFDAEMNAAPTREAFHQILAEKNAVHGRPGVPAIVND